MITFSAIRDAISNFRNFWISEISTDRSKVRKRRAMEPAQHLMENSEIVWSPKRRHLLDRDLIVLDGDNASSRSPRFTRRSPMNQNYSNETIELDDDDIVPVKKGNETRFQLRSKQMEKKGILTQQNGSAEKYPEDDIVLVSFTKPSNSTTWLSKNGSGINGAKSNEARNPGFGGKQPTLSYSVRLDDKMQYKKLLETSTGSENSFYTPMGKLFEYDTANMSNRTGRIMNMSKSSPYRSPKSSAMSTRDTIKKVLNNFENDSIVIKDSEDSDSDVVFVSPPSPKPDIQIEPVNSFKKVVDQTVQTNPEWIENLMRNHRSVIESRQKGIDKLKEVSEVHHKINNEMNIDLLTKRVTNALRLKDVILPIKEKEELPELTAAQIKMVQKAFKGHPDEVLARKFNLNITRRDITTLDGLNWLNDEVINFYMNLIIERGKDKRWPKSYAFNTFFYLKLSREGPESLRRWTKRVDLFSYDLICVPIHLGMHWCMAIIDLRNKAIRYYDSMASANDKCLHLLRQYLEAEHLDKKKVPLDTSSFKLENVKNIPHQMNGSDCGMFSCTFAEFITRDASITFKQQDMPYLRRKMVVEILTGEMLMK